ncbi:keratin-associated protein 13-1-like [Rhinolophus sinicus]|uniref:keratin-associated protein 13-1-like n=1 Tax=Rhinolophus sinicus TaxID=89399 RepID=UPI003D7B04F7
MTNSFEDSTLLPDFQDANITAFSSRKTTELRIYDYDDFFNSIKSGRTFSLFTSPVNKSYNCFSGKFSISFGSDLHYPDSCCGSSYPSNLVYSTDRCSPSTCQLGSSLYSGCQETCCEPTSCQTSCVVSRPCQIPCYHPRTSFTLCRPCLSTYSRSLGSGSSSSCSLGYGSRSCYSLGCGSSGF